ncbi:MAG: class I SAM-dependent methyltransferase [Vicinamibacterales bacterium]
MLEEGRRAAAEAGVAIELVRQDVHQMDLPDAFADVVTSRSTVHHWSDPARALREIDRVLKPGGVAIITDVRRDAPPDAVAAFNRLRADAGLPPSVLEEKYSVTELEAFCRDAGLADRCRFHVAEDGLAALGVTIVLSHDRG